MQRPTLDLRAHSLGGNTVAIVQRRKRTRIEKRVRQQLTGIDRGDAHARWSGVFFAGQIEAPWLGGRR